MNPTKDDIQAWCNYLRGDLDNKLITGGFISWITGYCYRHEYFQNTYDSTTTHDEWADYIEALFILEVLKKERKYKLYRDGNL
jgi:hypothetical protein